MKDDKQKMIERFRNVKKLGFIKSNRKNNTGIGKTFEDYVGVVENNKKAPDLFGFEIKSHREDSSSYITLFTKSPDFPKGANTYLKEKFGIPYYTGSPIHKLHTSIFANHRNSFLEIYSFQLLNDREHEIIYIGIYDFATGNLLDKIVGYSYQSIQIKIDKKIHNSFYVNAEQKYEGEDNTSTLIVRKFTQDLPSIVSPFVRSRRYHV